MVHRVDGGWLEGSWCGLVGGGVGGWRFHGVGGGVVGDWLEGSWGGCVCGCVGGGGVGDWRVHRLDPPMNRYNVKIFNFMSTHPPTHQTYPKCHSVTIHILKRVHGVGGGRVVGGFIGWVVVWVVGGLMGWMVVGWVVGWRVHEVGGCVVVGVMVGWVVGVFMA